MASLAAILAIGKPVALEASAEDRLTRGFISMTTRRPVSGWTANWMLQPPVSTPTARSTAMPTSRICWYSRSVRVMAGATVTESPVCTPIASMFSMEQITTTLSLRSRISSSSYSFQPSTDSSMSTVCTGESARPCAAIRRSIGSSVAMPEPRQPLGLEHPAGLGAGVVELGGLADEDRPGADHHHVVDVWSLRHQALFSAVL